MTCGDMFKGHEGPLTKIMADEGRDKDMKVGSLVEMRQCNCTIKGHPTLPHDQWCDTFITTSKASHFSADKSGVDQIPVEILLEWGQVFTMGAKKYGRDNWKSGTDWHEFYGSALRHLFAFWKGEDNDPESGLSHLAHAIWNIGAIRYYQLHQLGEDSRDELPDAEEGSDV